ncbi:MAG: hypothetical protein E8D46_04070 [Nitrospira sp.]|nr:MAG: hypothetical protein E8D46_04070 [Nitrospira sp.]
MNALRLSLLLPCLMIFAATTFSSATSFAHDLPGLMHDLTSPEIPESVKSFNRAYITEGDAQTRGVLVNAFIWPIPAQITVCFNKGPVELRTKIAAAMMEWSAASQGNVTFAFGGQIDPSNGRPQTFKECDGITHYNIRIGFVRGGGHWSQIGTMSDAVFPENSMNLDFDTRPVPDDQTIKELTEHETGHAVGFHHEHQSPASPCTKWNWDKILTSYQWPGSTLEEKKKSMHFNMERLKDEVLSTGQHAYTYTAYDNRSIMHYSFPPAMFTDGDPEHCSIVQPPDLSPTDKQAMKDAYRSRPNNGQRLRSIDTLLGAKRFSGFRDLLNQQRQLYPKD